ncbi:hypothetical protein V5740_02445 [Croceibacterium sp. TMG7-5b_MA50]|uniref:hypothetical protein n=1 Tax=Croceibacterium sp. TMG7-5b_MA50 TaxID=3121290 RepID=UPI00322173C8
MFTDFREDQPLPPPWQPPRREPARLTREQEKRLGQVLLANVVLIFAAAPLAGSSVLVGLWWLVGW